MALRNLIAASILLLSIVMAHSALAGSVTQPGDTMGTASGVANPEGFYFVNQANGGCAGPTPRLCVWTEVPLLAWTTPWKILGASLAIVTGPTTLVHASLRNKFHKTALFNPFVGTTWTWALGHGLGFTYLLGGYFDIDTNIAYSSSSLNQRFAFGYYDNGWNLTENTILGINFDQSNTDPQGAACPTAPQLACNNNFLNVDLTATKRFGKWELGLIGFLAADISTPIPGYSRQKKAAIGGLAGYYFGPAIVQIYGTTEVYERHYYGKDTRLWSRITVPLGHPPAPPRPFW